MAFITVPLFITTILVIRHVRRKNRERERRGVKERLDSRVVSATIVLSALTSELRERTLESLPPEMARSIVLVLPELPPVARSTIDKETRRWLSHFNPPRHDLSGLDSVEGSKLAAATVRLVLEDSNH